MALKPKVKAESDIFKDADAAKAAFNQWHKAYKLYCDSEGRCRSADVFLKIKSDAISSRGDLEWEAIEAYDNRYEGACFVDIVHVYYHYRYCAAVR